MTSDVSILLDPPDIYTRESTCFLFYAASVILTSAVGEFCRTAMLVAVIRGHKPTSIPFLEELKKAPD